MNDRDLATAWTALEPSADRARRIEARVFEWLDASQTSLAAEWLGVLRLHPWKGLGFSALGAVSLAFATPLGWAIARLL